MMSDTLADACDQIEQYLTEYPDMYAPCVAEIRAVYDAMRTLQRKLDNPLGWFDYQAPTPCLSCGMPAMDHAVLVDALSCPGGMGTTFTLQEES